MNRTQLGDAMVLLNNANIRCDVGSNNSIWPCGDDEVKLSTIEQVREYIDLMASEAAKQATIERIVSENSRPRRKAKRVAGQYVIGQNARNEALCLCWQGGQFGEVTPDILRAIFREARGLGFVGPIHVYGATSLVGETETYHFTQVAA